MKRLFILTLVLLSFGASNKTQAQIRRIPAEVTEAFKAKYPDTKNVEWKDKLTSFQASYEVDGIKYQSRFSSKGEWQQTEKELDVEALPAAVKDGYGKSKFTDWELKAVSYIESSSNGIQYRLFVRKSGVEKKYLFFDKEGKLIKDSITI